MHQEVEDFTKYLEAKKAIDDRSLNHGVWEKMVEAAEKPGSAVRPKILEIGCGIGTMLQRMIERGVLTNSVYTGIDIDPELIFRAKMRWRDHTSAFLSLSVTNPDVSFEVSDMFDFVASNREGERYDILIANAFMDLVDPASSIPLLLSLLNPGGIVYFTLNFDGVTIFEPVLEKDLDALIVRLYHETMDNRRINGKPSGTSSAGRILPLVFRDCRVETIAAGSSDWVLVPGTEGYNADETYFLHFIIRTVHDALLSHPVLDKHELSRWTGIRHDQIDRGELIYIAHQIDILGRAACV